MSRDLDDAIEKYEEFHRMEPRKTGTMHEVEIPHQVVYLGSAVHVMYRSGKVDPSTLRKPKHPLNYIHDHDTGVLCCAPEDAVPDGIEGTLEDVPFWIREVKAVTKLGECLGFRFAPASGLDIDVEGRKPLPELYCTPCGRALLVIQDKRSILAIMWGGLLGVEGRGIVG